MDLLIYGQVTFDKCADIIQWREEKMFFQQMLKLLGIQMQK